MTECPLDDQNSLGDQLNNSSTERGRSAAPPPIVPSVFKSSAFSPPKGEEIQPIKLLFVDEPGFSALDDRVKE